MIISALESVQNSFTRKLMLRKGGLDYNNVPPADRRNTIFGLSSLASRRVRNDMLMIFKILNGVVKVQNFFTLYQSSTRGSTLKLDLPLAKTKTRSAFFVHRAGSQSRKLSKNLLPASFYSFSKLVDRFVKS